MRAVPVVVCLFVSACFSSEKFDDEYLEAWCAAAESCAEGITCGDAEPGDPSLECVFDSKQARACLDADWTCNTDVEGEEFVAPPIACIGVYDCVASE